MGTLTPRAVFPHSFCASWRGMGGLFGRACGAWATHMYLHSTVQMAGDMRTRRRTSRVRSSPSSLVGAGVTGYLHAGLTPMRADSYEFPRKDRDFSRRS